MATILLQPVNKGGHSAINVTVNYTETNVDNLNNTSDVYYEVILSRNSWTTSWYGYSDKIYVTVTINGISRKVNIPRYNYGGKNLPGSVFGSGTVSGIQHNNDGSKTISISASITDNAKETYTSGSASSSSSMALTNIPRASSFSYSGTTLGSATTVNINRASSSFTHRVKYIMGEIVQNYENIDTSVSFTRPYSDAEQFGTNSASGTGSITVITYNGNTEIGRTTQNIVMTIPDNSSTRPVMNSATTVTDAITSIAEKFGTFIQKNSRLLFTFNFSARYGANIKEYSLTIENKTYTSSSSTITTDIINTSGSVNYSYKVKDTRGRTYTENGIISVTAYSKPGLNISVERESQSGLVSVVGNITSLNNLNDKLVVIKYKIHSSQTYQSVTVPLDNDEYSFNKTITIPLSESNSYDFYGTVSDYFGSFDTSIERVSTAPDLLNFRNNGQGIGIGKRAEFNGLDIEMDMYYKGITIDNYIKNVIDDYLEVYDEEDF